MKKPLVLFLVIFFFILGSNMHADTYVPSKKELAANRVLVKTAETLAKRHDIYTFGDGGRMLYEIELLSLSFQIKHRLTIEEGRKIAIDCVEELLKNINEDEEIRPFLKNYPFTSENICVDLFIYDEKGYNLYYPDICIVDASHNKILYQTDEKGSKGRFKNGHEESYQEALKLVKGESF